MTEVKNKTNFNLSEIWGFSGYLVNQVVQLN
jgi:hypothetical protein